MEQHPCLISTIFCSWMPLSLAQNDIQAIEKLWIFFSHSLRSSVECWFLQHKVYSRPRECEVHAEQWPVRHECVRPGWAGRHCVMRTQRVEQSRCYCEVFYRCDLHLTQHTLNKADCPPCGWASCNQLRALRAKTVVCWRRNSPDCNVETLPDHRGWFSSCKLSSPIS